MFQTKRNQSERREEDPFLELPLLPVVLVGVSDRRNGLFMGRLIAFMALFLPANGAGRF